MYYSELLKRRISEQKRICSRMQRAYDLHRVTIGWKDKGVIYGWQSTGWPGGVTVLRMGAVSAPLHMASKQNPPMVLFW